MRKVLNKAQYGVQVKLGDEVVRFSARETKLLPASIVETDDFKRHSTLVDIGVYKDPSQSEIKSQQLFTADVVDNKSTKENVVKDTEVEEKEKPKRKRTTNKNS
jgi:hypothetical protein